MNVTTPDSSPLPPPPPEGRTAGPHAAAAAPAAEPSAAERPAESPVMPAAGSNRIPQLAGANPQTYVAPKMERRSRSKVYGLGAVFFIVVSVAGYFGFRSYIYGEDAPPVPVLDDLGN